MTAPYVPNLQHKDDVFMAHPRIMETRPPWSEVYRWQRHAAWFGVAAVTGWAAAVGLLIMVIL